VLKRYGASAFDQDTVQDMKYHREAHEVYFALWGKFQIYWKPKESQTIAKLQIEATSTPWAFIPSGHCLTVTHRPKQRFLAAAFKTKITNVANGGKQRGKNCDSYRAGSAICKSCEKLREIRERFFHERGMILDRCLGDVNGARSKAAHSANEFIQQI